MRKMLTPANLIATAALAIAVSGGGYAAVKATVGGGDVINRSLTGVDVKRGSLTGAHLRNGSVRPADLTPAAVKAFGDARTVQLSVPLTIAPGGVGGAQALCPLNFQTSYPILGGGWTTNGVIADYRIITAEPVIAPQTVEKDGYNFEAYNPGSAPLSFTVTAICLVPAS